jgi:Protein of unknown function (DUF2911)
MKLFIFLFFVSTGTYAQAVQDTTKGSIPTIAELQIGKVGLRIGYYSPAVRGRIIWGGLVPYGQVWVGGAHSATQIEFNIPVEINGVAIKPGRYALFIIPNENEWTIIINKNWEQHLADEYSDKDDITRFMAKPEATGLRNRLKYTVDKTTDTELSVTFNWEKIKISFPVKILQGKPKYKLPKTKVPAAFTSLEHTMHGMSHAFSKNLPMNRNGSGTGWLPDNTPMYAWMHPKEKWSYMVHGGIFVRQNWQNVNNDYQSGGKQFDAPGWAMAMAQRKAGKNGLFLFRGMMSIDPITVGGSGYPLLFQSGEAFDGKPLVNRQHPHDLISELSVGYTHAINSDVDLSLYIGYPGEPAIGPTAFMHRISSINNPDAPLSHHWQDATHITFGVATLGVRYKKIKVEGSSFTGREPNAKRFDFDEPRFDSYAYRLSYSPSKSIVMQASQAFLKSPEELFSEENIKRTTASIIYSRKPTNEKHVTAALIWGYNDAGGDHKEQSILAEANYQIKKIALYSRYEYVQKSSEELQLTSFVDEIFSIQAFTLGANHRIANWFKTDIAVGAQSTFNFIPESLNGFYGSNPISMQVYLRIVPQQMKM